MATVQSIIKKYKTFRTVENLRGRGQKPEVTPALVRKIGREVKKNLRITSKAILVNLGSAGVNVTRQTVQRTLHTPGLHKRRPRSTPLLQIRHAKKSPLGLCKCSSEQRRRLLVFCFMVI